MHVHMIPYVVELGVGLAAVLAYQQLIRPSSILIGLEPLAIAEAPPITILIN